MKLECTHTTGHVPPRRLQAGCKLPVNAAVAQSVEHRIRNAGVGGSNPSCGTTLLPSSKAIPSYSATSGGDDVHSSGQPSHAAVRIRWERMIRLVAVIFASAVATSALAMSPAPLHQPDGMITQVRQGCGPFRVRVNGICVARTTNAISAKTRRCARWSGGACIRWY